MKRILLFLLLIISISVAAQPSSGIGFHFRLFGHKGKPVGLNEFCRSYQMLGEGFRNDQTSCTNEYISAKNFYNDRTGFFNGDGSVVYGDLVRTFVYKTDTMTLILETNGGRRTSYTIDSLIIKPGKYYLTERYSKIIDFDLAEVAYYNFTLDHVNRLKEHILNYTDSGAYKELTRLKNKYHIRPDDFEIKTLKDLKRQIGK